MRNKIALIAFHTILAASCSKSDSDKKETEASQEPASCKLLHLNSESLFTNSDHPATYSQVCFETATMLNVQWCETSAGQFDKDLKFYELFKGKSNCPTENVVATCTYKDYYGQSLTVFHYSNDAIKTDLNIVELSCKDQKGAFLLK